MVLMDNPMAAGEGNKDTNEQAEGEEKEVGKKVVDFDEARRRSSGVIIDVYSGEYICNMYLFFLRK